MMIRASCRLLAATLFVAALPMLQGCFPLVVAGAGTAAMVAVDRRQPDVVLGDQRIELSAGNRIRERFREAHVNVTSFNRVVLLTGEAPTAQVKADIERLVAEITEVKSVVNEIQVAGNSSFASRSNDTYLTGKVKASFIGADKFSPNNVKVITESGVVYLMGLVTRKEADDATEVTRSTGGVQKVVRVFEYVVAPTAPAK
jgi:osmotically-inducible protein OsmY